AAATVLPRSMKRKHPLNLSSPGRKRGFPASARTRGVIIQASLAPVDGEWAHADDQEGRPGWGYDFASAKPRCGVRRPRSHLSHSGGRGGYKKLPGNRSRQLLQEVGAFWGLWWQIHHRL